jgi:hypothetical protein
MEGTESENRYRAANSREPKRNNRATTRSRRGGHFAASIYRATWNRLFPRCSFCGGAARVTFGLLRVDATSSGLLRDCRGGKAMRRRPIATSSLRRLWHLSDDCAVATMKLKCHASEEKLAFTPTPPHCCKAAVEKLKLYRPPSFSWSRVFAHGDRGLRAFPRRG